MLFKILKDQFFSKKVINVKRTKIERLYLKVPYQNKDIAKRMGARWDEIKKKWYIPTSHQAIEKFSAWLPDLILKAQYFHLARTSRMCYNCGYDVAIYAIVLPKGFSKIDSDAMLALEMCGLIDEPILFSSHSYESILAYVRYISPNALGKIYEITGNSLTFCHTDSIDTSYYCSVCKYCGYKLGDNYNICETDAPFTPSTDRIKRIKLYTIESDITVIAGQNSIGFKINALQ